MPWTPSSPSNTLKQWLKADAVSLNNGDPVSTWTASAGVDATAAGTARPTFVTNVRNGLPIVRFDGVANTMSTGTFAAQSQPLTYLFAFKPNRLDNADYYLGGSLSIYKNGFLGPGYTVTAGANEVPFGTVDMAWHSILVEFNGGSTKYQFDGGAWTTLTASPGPNTLTTMAIGSTGSSFFSQIDVGEVAIWSGILSDADKQSASDYSKARWVTHTPQTFTATSASSTDVQFAINQTVDGDTVVIPATPAGDVSWTSTVNIGTAITLSGQTTIGVDPITGIADGTCNDATILIDNVPSIQGAAAPMISVFVSGVRITGLTFVAGLQKNPDGMTIQVGNGATFLRDVRIDHNHFKSAWQGWIQAAGWVYGLADHNVMEVDPNTEKGGMSFNNGKTMNGSDYGDGAFADLTYYGTDKFWFVEDNYIINHSGYQTKGNTDSYFGGRHVYRYNNCYNVTPNTHGTEGPYRAQRALEIYNNNFHNSGIYNTDPAAPQGIGNAVIGNMGLLRGGVAMIHDNNYFGDLVSGMQLSTFRTFQGHVVGYGSADGTNPRDTNDISDQSANVAIGGGINGLYASGTATADSFFTDFNGNSIAPQKSTFGTLTDSTKSGIWTLNQWAGYTVLNLANGDMGLISSSTTTGIITYHSYNSESLPCTFHAGDGYQIHRVLIAADQAGRGKSDLITRDVSDSRIPHPSWNNGQLEGVFSWYNKNGSTDITIGPNINDGGVVTFLADRDFFNRAPQAGDHPSAYPYNPYIHPHPLSSGAPPPPPDTIAPQVTWITPSSGDTVSSAVSLSATCTDNVSVGGVTFKYGSTIIGSEITQGALGTYSISWDTVALGVPNGNYTLHAIGRDTPASNRTDVTIPVTVNNTVSAPVVTITSPVNNSVQGGIISIAATVSGQQAINGVTFQRDGVTIGSEDTSAPYSVSLDTSLLTNGVHIITATARYSGSQTVSSGNTTITVSNGTGTPPPRHKKKKDRSRRP